jgi:prophage maintenance system killer protein
VSEPVFLTVDDVLQLHEDTLEADGGAAGLRDRGLLESAVHAPQASFGGQLDLATGAITRSDAAQILRKVAAAT